MKDGKCKVNLCLEPTGAMIFGQKCNKLHKERKLKSKAESHTDNGTTHGLSRGSRNILFRPRQASAS